MRKIGTPAPTVNAPKGKTLKFKRLPKKSAEERGEPKRSPAGELREERREKRK
jgi:hypothetical protein